MEPIRTDVLVAGGGIAGLTAAARLAAEGLSVLCVDPARRDAPEAGQQAQTAPAPVGGAPAPSQADLRTTAFLMPAVATFRAAGAWPAMQREAVPLQSMRIVSQVDSGADKREIGRGQFDAADLGDAPFGYNITNESARAALARCLTQTATATLLGGVGVEAAVRRGAGVVARLSDGRRVEARLLVAADGRDSRLASQAGIKVRRWHYGQRAIVTTVFHDTPHDNISTEIHRPGGPLVLVPLPDLNGRHRSSVVWLNDAARSARLAALDDMQLGAALTADTAGLFGPLEITGARASWPIIAQLADRMTAARLALVGEPAHVMPPTGAQGANMSVADAEALASLVAGAKERGEDIGSDQLLDAYARARLPEVHARVLAIDALNRLVRTDIAPLAWLRSLGLQATTTVPPLRRAVMKLGLGAG